MSIHSAASEMESRFDYQCIRIRLEPAWILLCVKANRVSRGRITVNKMSLDLHIPETVNVNSRIITLSYMWFEGWLISSRSGCTAESAPVKKSVTV